MSPSAKIVNDTVSLMTVSWAISARTGDGRHQLSRGAFTLPCAWSLSCFLQEDRERLESCSVDQTHRQSFAGQDLLAEAARKQMNLPCPLQALDESRPTQLGPPCPTSRNVLQNRETLSVKRLRFGRRWCVLANLSDKSDEGLPELRVGFVDSSRRPLALGLSIQQLFELFCHCRSRDRARRRG